MFKVFAVRLVFFLSILAGCFASDRPLFVKADKVEWFQDAKELLLTGNVSVKRKNDKGETRELRCESLRYNRLLDKITARGKVESIEPDGTVVSCETLELDSRLDSGFLSGIKLLTEDAARLSAKTAKRENGKVTTFLGAEYSPCKLCSDGSVTWKLEAESVEHDSEARTIKYKNAFLTFKGVKVFYLPYFSHPDPSVKNKSGLLSPTFGVDRDLGAYTSIPYVFTNGHRDLTVTPMIMSRQKPLLAAEYRQRFVNGIATFGGSYTQTKNDKVKLYSKIPRKSRWNASSYLAWDVTDRTRLLVDLNRSSDTNYLTKYRLNKRRNAFDRKKNLISTVCFERFCDNSYFGSKGQSFQTDTPETTPLVLPRAEYKTRSEVFKNGGYLEWNSDFLAIARKKPILTRTGERTYRLSSGLAWNLPYVTPGGHVFKATLSTRGDAYVCQRYAATMGEKITARDNRVATRLFPQGSLDWRYPLITNVNGIGWVLEPRGLLAIAPNNLNRKRLPNEDSRYFTLDDTSLFLPNRFDGIDKVDEGQRVVYGVDNRFSFADKRKASLFFGQSYRLDGKSVAGKNQGEGKRGSDYITRVSYDPNEWFAIFARTAFAYKNLKPRYSEIGSGVGYAKSRLEVAYAHAKKGLNASGSMVSQLSWRFSSKLNDDWSLSVAQIRNLRSFKKGILATFAGIAYEDDCFKSSLNLYRSHYRDRDIKPDTGFTLRFEFKNLGTFTPISTTSYPASILTKFRN